MRCTRLLRRKIAIGGSTMRRSGVSFLQVYFRVHDLVQHSPDSQFVVGEGVEHHMVLDPLGPVPLTQAVALLAVFRFTYELLDAVLKRGKVSIGLVFASLIERVNPSANQNCFGCLVLSKRSRHARPLSPLVSWLRV